MKIGIVGNGVVGHATARCFLEHAEVRVYDVVKERSTNPLVSPLPNQSVLDCDIIFVCLPTPQKPDSYECDLSFIEGFFDDVTTRKDVYPDRVRECNFVLRSTVPIGTTRKLAEKYGLPNLVHSPEFLTARCAIVDAQIPSRNIIGSDSGTPDYSVKTALTQNPVILYNLLARRFPGTPIFHMTSEESEAVKLVLNSFFAVKVSFLNEAHTLIDKLGLCWETVMKGVLSDGRIAHSHTKVPGPDGKFGFGGECLPKDLSNFISCMSSLGLDPLVALAASIRNEEDRKRHT